MPGGAVDFSNFTLDNIDKIEVVHGAESALTGSDAMTGSVEILTHRGSTRTPLLEVEADGGSFSTGRGMVQLSGLVGPLDYSGCRRPISIRKVRARTTLSSTARSRAISDCASPNTTPCASLSATTPAAPASPAKRYSFRPISPTQNLFHNLTAGLTLDFSTGTHWQHQLSAFETDIHQLINDPQNDFSSANQYNRAGFEEHSSYVLPHATVSAGYYYEVENGFARGPEWSACPPQQSGRVSSTAAGSRRPV